MKILITGGIRSGKSRYALERVRSEFPDQPKCFIATAEAFDEEMKERIRLHQKERGADFVTFEEPLRLAEAARRAQREFPVVIIDCLTLWLNNLFFHLAKSRQQIEEQIRESLEVIETAQNVSFFIVTNEAGWGPVGESAPTRNFVDRLGTLNQEISRLSEEVVLVVAGVPTFVKKGVEIVRLDS